MALVNKLCGDIDCDSKCSAKEYLETLRCYKNYEDLKELYEDLQICFEQQQGLLDEQKNRRSSVEKQACDKLRSVRDKFKSLQNAYLSAQKNQITPARLAFIETKIIANLEQHYDQKINKAFEAISTARRENEELRAMNRKIIHGIVDLNLEGDLKHQFEELCGDESALYELLTGMATEQRNKVKKIMNENSTFKQNITDLENRLVEQTNKHKLAIDACKGKINELTQLLAESKVDRCSAVAERDGLKNQIWLLTEECNQLRVELRQEHQRANKVECDKRQSDSQLDEVFQRARLELTEVREESARKQDQLSNQLNKEIGQNHDLNRQLDAARAKCRQVEQSIVDCEIEARQRFDLVSDQLTCKLSLTESQLTNVSDQLIEVRQAVQLASRREHQLAEQLRLMHDRCKQLESMATIQSNKCNVVSEASSHDELDKKKSDSLVSSNHQVATMPDANDMAKGKSYATKSTTTETEATKSTETEAMSDNGRNDFVKKTEAVANELKARLRNSLKECAKTKKVAKVKQEELKVQLKLTRVELESMRRENETLKSNLPVSEGHFQQIQTMLQDFVARHKAYSDLLLDGSSFIPFSVRNNANYFKMTTQVGTNNGKSQLSDERK